jgi:hypothetical protein
MGELIEGEFGGLEAATGFLCLRCGCEKERAGQCAATCPRCLEHEECDCPEEEDDD